MIFNKIAIIKEFITVEEPNKKAANLRHFFWSIQFGDKKYTIGFQEL